MKTKALNKPCGCQLLKHSLYPYISGKNDFVLIGKDPYNSYQLNKKPNFFPKTGEPFVVGVNSNPSQGGIDRVPVNPNPSANLVGFITGTCIYGIGLPVSFLCAHIIYRGEQ
jgi:hypothetical protein